MSVSPVSVKIMPIAAWLFMAFAMQGCTLFASHYDAGAYQNFTSLKAYHVKFLEDYRQEEGKQFDETKLRASCDSGELRFREATEYAKGRGDELRIRAIGYAHNVFKNDCRQALDHKKLLGATYVDENLPQVKQNYDWAIAGELSRVGGN